MTKYNIPLREEKASTESIDNYKDFANELVQIKTLTSWSKAPIKLTSQDLSKTEGVISKGKNEFIVKIYDMNFQMVSDVDRFDSIKGSIDGIDYLINSFSIDGRKVDLNIAEKRGKFESICSFNEIQSLDFDPNQKSKFKCFISTPISKFPQFHYIFETVTYQDDESNYFYDCLRLKIKGQTFDFTQIKDNGNGFYCIESFKEIDFETFDEVCYTIKQGFGYITGYMPGGDEYYFSEDRKFYHRNHHRPSIKSMFKPLHYNPHNILHHKPEIADKYIGKLNRMSLEIFSNLISQIYFNEQFSALILLLLDATSARSFIIIPSLFSVAIESLSKLITKGETGKEFLMTDSKISKIVMNELKNVIDANLSEIGTKNHAKLKLRIEGLNRPIIKERLTNDEKLIQPFDQLGIELTESDLKAISHRNDLLHGNILLKIDEVRTVVEKDNYMGYISAKLATLINALVLKYIGYEGYIINHSKFYEECCMIESDEEYYRLI